MVEKGILSIFASMMTHPRLDEIRALLKQYWGYDAFRPLQEDIILSVLDGHDTLALLPTGGGKSICFQVPAMVLQGLCMVVSPLIALMKDQVEHLRAKQIKAAAIYSGMSQSEIEDALSLAMFDPECRFLYVSPERLQTESFKLNFAKMPVKMIAVDEAHCISQWGYDFRPPYLQIAQVRQAFPKVPVLALTATATPEVVQDIQLRLQFKNERVFQKSFKRDNLTYFVVKEEDKNGRMLRIMNRYPGTGIVYVRNRRKTADVAEFLQRHGISADFYHAGLDAKTRDAKQTAWMNGKIRVIVATNAFGMGIDKPDVRFVIHIDLPDSLEAYFQEAGRGGRDEKEAVAILLYDDNDLRQLKRNFTSSFPTLDRVREVYNELCQSYYIEIGSGQNVVRPFFLNEHARALKMEAMQYFNALKLIENAGWIAISEHLRDRSQIYVRMRDEELRSFEENFPHLDEFLKLLLRSYAGLFSQYVNIDEKVLAQRFNTSESHVVEMLQELHRHKVITYRPQSHIPMIIFVQNRIDERYLQLDPKLYEQRKQRTLDRLNSVVHYVTSTQTCRSQLLLHYFGEYESTPCLQCDVCRQNVSSRTYFEQFAAVQQAAKELLQKQMMSKKELLTMLSVRYEESLIEEVIRWLSDQNDL